LVYLMIQEVTSAGKPYIHVHSAHCESGVTASLYRDKGVEISEPLIFGIGSGIFFGHLPFLKMGGVTISTFRSQPGAVFRKSAKRLGGKFITERFRNPQKGMDALRRVLKTGQIVGLTTNIYWLSYFPNRFRFQFNGHNVVVLHEIENGFRVSDPMLEWPVDCPTEDLERARFAHGPLEPHGFMYYPQSVNPHPDLRAACVQGMKDTCKMMLKIPLPIFGIRGMRYLAKKIIRSPDKLGFMGACRELSSVVRMQEAAGLFGLAQLNDLSERMTAIGDTWREFAVVSARIIKQRGKSEETFAKAGSLMLNCAQREEQLFRDMDRIVRKIQL